LAILPDKFDLTSADDSGVFYAAITLLNLLNKTLGHILFGNLTDRPRFIWRSRHLDCAKQFFETDSILRVLDLTVVLKLNKFHWYSSDDEAFRIEIQTLPHLWQKSTYLGEDKIVQGVFGGSLRSCGSY
jgi:hexosaminidase